MIRYMELLDLFWPIGSEKLEKMVVYPIVRVGRSTFLFAS
jgi:hypothetical protein